ncbi:phage major capsid protein [Streptomyces sp. NPDC002855]|uniref:phage major capsid protein n=1 Tax=Streptomyces sp. NPDC002855 TaxID=3154437 RepID=UPI00332B78C2
MSEANFDFPALRDAQGKLDAARKRQKSLFDEAGPELDMSRIKSISGSTADKVKAIQEAETEMAELKASVESLRDVARAAANAKGYQVDGGSENGGRDVKFESKSFGDLLTESLGDLKRFKHQSRTLDVELKADFLRTAGWDPFDMRSDRVELTPLRPAVHVVSSLPTGTISQSDYKYMEETTHTATNTVEIAEAGTYGEAAFALTERSKPVEKIAAWVPVSDEQLEDEAAAGPYLRNRLTQQIQRRLDSQVLVGNGSTPNLLGTESVSGIQTQAKGVDTIPDAAHKLFTLIRSDGFSEPSVGFISPTKWQDVVLERTADGLYVWGHPSTQGPVTLWGVPIVQTTAVTSTKLVAGDYATYSMLFIRRGIDVQVTNAHSDFFIKGKQAIRADMRAVVVHFRPKAFGTVTGL